MLTFGVQEVHKYMKRDQKLVALFLERFNELTGSTFQVKEWPDDNERTKPAVEAIAVDELGTTLAIEHTLLQPFDGEREDTTRFLLAVGTLEKDESLRLPGYCVYISFYVGSIPKGVKWSAINPAIREWLREHIAAFPTGHSKQVIPNLPFELRVGVTKTAIRDGYERIFFMRYEPPESLNVVMQTAMRRKLPKLVGTDADRRILLLEQNDIAHGHGATHEAIKTAGKDFPELASVNEIWVVDTVGWESGDYLSYLRAYPDLMVEHEFRE
jgi:hypothetical protein